MLLVAMPGMEDPRFARSVIYLCAHTAEGAMGLVVNQAASEVTFPAVIGQLGIEADSGCEDTPVHVGGPVQPSRGFVLHSSDYVQDSTLVIDDHYALTATVDVLRAIEREGRSPSPDERVALLRFTGWGGIPASFNLDGTSIYLTMAAVFIAQATDTPMTLVQQLTLLAVLLLTSKGAAGVTGSGFIVLAATLSAVGNVPVAGLALILGVDRFMSECRSLTNFIGNAVATVVVSRWEGALDRDRLKLALEGREGELPLPVDAVPQPVPEALPAKG